MSDLSELFLHGVIFLAVLYGFLDLRIHHEKD